MGGTSNRQYGLDELIGGGIETQSITEVFENSDRVKVRYHTNWQLLFNYPLKKGGLSGECVFIDTENTFRPERVETNSRRPKTNVKVLRPRYIFKAFNSSHQILMADKVNELIQSGANIKLVILTL